MKVAMIPTGENVMGCVKTTGVYCLHSKLKAMLNFKVSDYKEVFPPSPTFLDPSLEHLELRSQPLPGLPSPRLGTTVR